MRIYVSSTTEDLSEFRAAAVRQLSMEHQVVSMVNYTADARAPVEKVLADVANSEVYVGLFAFRYGFVPPQGTQSITEMEFRQAVRHGLKILIFMVPDDAAWPRRFVDGGEVGDRMGKLREELASGEHFTIKPFRDQTELLTVLPAAISTLNTVHAAPVRVAEASPRAPFREFIKPLNFDAEKNKHLAHFAGREWVEERLDNWLTERPDSRVFCLLGGPGIGKSAIACHWSYERKDVAASHYCVHGHAQRTDPKQLLNSIIAQISARLPEYEKRLAAMDTSEVREIVHNGDARAVFDNLLLTPLAGAFPAPDQHLLVIIDGLDEAGRNQDNDLASFLGEVWGALPGWLRLVVTARPEMDVAFYLGNLHPFTLYADTRENYQDIQLFLRRELTALGKNPEDRVVKEIVDKSEGMFLYANLVLEEIRSGGLSLSQTAEFPEGLAGYYKRWFDRKFQDLESYHRDFHKLVSVIVAQKAPLPLSLLSATTDLRPYDLDQRLTRLGVLFPLRPEQHGNQKVWYVTLMHKSLHDWLTGKHHLTGRPRAGSFAAEPELGNNLLTEQGWRVYLAGRLSAEPYFRQTLLSHLSQGRETEKLSKILLDPGLLDTVWFNDSRYLWQQHVSDIRHEVSLTKLVQEWIDTHCAPRAGASGNAAVAGKLGRLFQEMGAFDEAMLLAEAALAIWDADKVTDSPEMVSILLAIGMIQSVRDELDRATASYEKALAIAERAYARDSPHMAEVLYQLCIFYTKGKRDYTKAWDCLEKSIAIYSHSNPPNYAGMANCINDKAVILEAEGKAADYLSFYQEALAQFQKSHPNGHPEMVATLTNIGYELRKRDKVAEATDYLRRAVAMAERILLPQHEYSSDARSRLTGALLAQGKYDDALKVMRVYVAELERFPGSDHEDTAAARLHLCQALWSTLHFSDSNIRADYKDELRLQCQRIRSLKPPTTLGLLDLADDFHLIAESGLGDFVARTATRGCRANAEKQYKNEADCVSAKCFADAVDTVMRDRPLSELLPQLHALWHDAQPQLKHQADCLPRLRRLIVTLISWAATVRLRRNNDVEGIRQAFDLIASIGAEIPETLDRLAGLAVAFKRRRHYSESESLCDRVLERSERLLGPEHAQTLTYVSNLAWLREYGGRFRDAEPLFRRAYVASCRVRGFEHSGTITEASSLIACLLRMRDAKGAIALFHEFLGNLPRSESPTSPRYSLASKLNQRAIELKDEFAEYYSARVVYELSLEVRDDATTCCNLALLLWSCIGDFANAAVRFEQALQLDPSSGHINSTYAMFLLHTQRDARRALEYFERSMKLAPTEHHIAGNFATWFILDGDLRKAWQLAKRSMKLCLPAPDRVMARPLFCAAAIMLLEQRDPSVPLGQLKTLFERGIAHVTWVVTALLDDLGQRLPPDKSALLRAITEAIADRRKLSVLEADPIWRAMPLVPLEASWPEVLSNSTISGSM